MAKKKIGIIDADLLDHGTRHPNLALMKISGYYKDPDQENGCGEDCEVELILDQFPIDTLFSYDDCYDLIFVSKVFSFSKTPFDRLIGNVITKENPVYKKYHLGGTGFFENDAPNLPEKIEHHKPDYDLYLNWVEREIKNGHVASHYSDYVDYSIGFTTRGCFRKCKFCVNQKYNKAEKHSPIEEFLDETKPYIYLWDDNFLAYQGWEEILDSLEKTKKPFQFRQGLDIRLMTDRVAERLANTKYHGDFIFAYDHLKDHDAVVRGLKTWRKYTNRTTKLYVLSGFESQDEKDIISIFERIHTLMKFGCLPYIMRHENYKKSPYANLYIQIARWCNQPQFFKKKSFKEFCIANQEYHKGEGLCMAYKSLLLFEEKFPEISQKYFNLRFDKENQYNNAFGYGRRYSCFRNCEDCIKDNKCFSDYYMNKTSFNTILSGYFSKELDFQCVVSSDYKCNGIDINLIINKFIDDLINISWLDFYKIINHIKKPEKITAANIPQFSAFKDAIKNTIIHLNDYGKELTYDDLGCYFDTADNKVAKRKYGENHSKLATLLDLAIINKRNNKAYISESEFGKVFLQRSDREQTKILAKLMFRIPIVREIVLRAMEEKIEAKKYLKIEELSLKTQERRYSNLKEMLNFVIKNSNNFFKSLKNNIIDFEVKE